ncbi:uncharacterized protein LOC115885866 isoform X2 [Sitophilus oryzae]|uniref:Uncharacterized protein LOC115885866 isoform X2 n=1 Tax=Sitophilus oryzae TaxID=7048 RepID=A0A6J2YBX5_SITOR|nr:uncharacterized protein LOC115885866 isoform X2 [Sitophilus oryzae]
MAQYFEVLSRTDANAEQAGQIFNRNPETEPTQIRYILADDAQQFPTQQLVHLSSDQVMVVDESQQQSQGVLIDKGQIAYQAAPQPQFSAVVQNATGHMNTQPIYYMEPTSGSADSVQAVQAVVDQTPAIEQNLGSTPVHPLVINQQVSAPNHNLDDNGANQSNQRRVLQIRTGMRPNISLPNEVCTVTYLGIRPGGANVRAQQAIQQVRTLASQSQVRLRTPIQQVRNTQVQQMTPPINSQQKTQVVSMINRQLSALQQQKQQNQPAQTVQQPQVMQSQQDVHLQSESQPGFQKNLLRTSAAEHSDMEEAMDTSNPITPFRKTVDQRLPPKNPIIPNLPAGIKITPKTNSQQQSSLNQTISQVLHQVVSQQAAKAGQGNGANNSPPKKGRAPPRSPKAANTANRARVQRIPINFNPRMAPPHIQRQSPPKFPLNQQPRFPNQQQGIPQRVAQQPAVQQQTQPAIPHQPPAVQQPQQVVQQHQMQPVQQRPQVAQQPQAVQQNQQALMQPVPQQPQQQANHRHQNGSGESQMNYVITPPTPNRPRQQRPLPSYIPSSHIQELIDKTPIAEEFSDSIRMLILLENGEQRLITFTLPREACTIQEVLEQVSVPFTSDTNIQVTEANTNGINYIVTVGNIANFPQTSNEDDSTDTCEPDSTQQTPPHSSNQTGLNINNESQSSQEPPKPPTPEPPKELPKLIPGKLAVCSYCGYTGEDFNRCRRCSRKLPDNVRSIDAPIKSKMSSPDSTKELPKSSSSSQITGLKRKVTKSKQSMEESVVISSDEEDDEKKSPKSVSEQLLKSLGASVTISPVTKEPSLNEVKKHVRKVIAEPSKIIRMTLKCRTVRIGSYRFYPAEDVIIDSKCIIIKAPVFDSKTEIKAIRIDRGDVVKVLVCFNKALPVVFYYLNAHVAPDICEALNLTKESGIYYDPIEEKEDSYRKVTLLPEDLSDEHRFAFQEIYSAAPNSLMEDINAKEANDILIKTCPKDGSSGGFMSFSEIKQILLYPKEGQGRLSINTEDYVCLAVDQFLNDKIIDFYLKYLWENLPSEEQEKVHIFSTFFYKRLTTKPTKAARKSHPYEVDPTLSAAEKRHCRVKNWTKKINLFEKDYIVVPINENAHWFLAIICFPGQNGPQTFDGKPYNPEPKPKRVKKVKKEKPAPCDELMLSDKDEAESEDSDLESDDSEESAITPPVIAPVVSTPRSKKESRPPIKQPCILIFDSLAGPSRSRVVATLRDYLTVEYKNKMETERIYNRDVIKGASVKVPQQTNFTDCGLYLLQYVEQFFKDPIKNFYIPIKGVENWFEEIIVTKKREDICNLIKSLMEEDGISKVKIAKILPEIALPTLNGKIIEKLPDSEDHETGDEAQEDMFTDIDDSEILNNSVVSAENGDASSDNEQNCASDENCKEDMPPQEEKPSRESVSDKSEITSTVMQLRPSVSEIPRPSNKDTLSYLKAKRINRHKPTSDMSESKKAKLDN